MNTDPRIEKFAQMAQHYQAEKAKGVPAHLISPMPWGVGAVRPDGSEAETDVLHSTLINGCSDVRYSAFSPLQEPHL